MSRPRRQRRGIDIFNLSFLDVVSCGFGAIILLLVIVKVSEPAVIERLAADLSGLVKRLETELARIRGETPILARESARIGSEGEASPRRESSLRTADVTMPPRSSSI